MIYIECKPDFVLVKSLGVPRREIIHLGGKPEICKQLEKRENCKGLVDEDPFSVQPSYLRRLEVQENLSSYGLKVLKDGSKKNDLIVLCPRLEDWILKAAKEAKVDVKRYNLPDDGEKLHKMININITKFEKLIEDLKGKSRMLYTLEKFIRGG